MISEYTPEERIRYCTNLASRRLVTLRRSTWYYWKVFDGDTEAVRKKLISKYPRLRTLIDEAVADKLKPAQKRCKREEDCPSYHEDDLPPIGYTNHEFGDYDEAPAHFKPRTSYLSILAAELDTLDEQANLSPMEYAYLADLSRNLLTRRQIANKYGVQPSTVTNTIQRAVKKLSDTKDSDQEEEGVKHTAPPRVYEIQLLLSVLGEDAARVLSKIPAKKAGKLVSKRGSFVATIVEANVNGYTPPLVHTPLK